MAFSYYRSVTCNHTQCGSSNSSNFPVLVYISDATFKDVGNGGHVQSSVGADIIFYADSGGSTQLQSEIESYDNVNGILWAWVNVSTLSASVDTVFYVFYGNSSPPSRTTMTWNGYEAVWHLGQASSAQAVDSTANAHNSTSATTTQATGQISKGQQFVAASTNSINVPSISALGSATKAVLSGWIKRSAAGDAMGFGEDDGIGTKMFSFEPHPNGNVYINICTNGVAASFVSNDANWHHVVAVYDGTGAGNAGKIFGYLDGAPQTLTYYSTIPSSLTAAASFLIGRAASDAFYSNGYHDETRLSVGSVAHGTADWILAEYNNQSNPGSFLTIGVEGAPSGITVDQIMSALQQTDPRPPKELFDLVAY